MTNWNLSAEGESALPKTFNKAAESVDIDWAFLPLRQGLSTIRILLTTAFC